MEKDLELFQLLQLSYPHQRIHIQDAGDKLQWPMVKVIGKVQTLVQLNLLKFCNELAIKVYDNVRVPVIPETLPLRKALLIENIDKHFSTSTTSRNWTVNLTESGKEDLLRAVKAVEVKCHVNQEKAKESDFVRPYNVITFFNPL